MSSLKSPRVVEFRHYTYPNSSYSCLEAQFAFCERGGPKGRVWLVHGLSYWRPDAKQLYYAISKDRKEEVEEYGLL